MMLVKVMDLIMFADMSYHFYRPIGRISSPKILSSPFVRLRGRSFCLNVVVDEHFMSFVW